MSETPEQHTGARRQALFSIDEFCADHGICRAMYYKLQKRGRGPAQIKLGARTLISAESAAAWRHRMQAETNAA